MTCEAIIRSFPGRVLTVTVLCAHKRPLSFDSCTSVEQVNATQPHRAHRQEGVEDKNHCLGSKQGNLCVLNSDSRSG
jgi:hypothetical protein